ncbi:ankyrin repeat domain-containing protein [Cohnella phaseoli]|uniref:Ankyrin repeat protein n=1 Tax=Cohnella phaseoli TaxID=456490 RepID=A0A3D9JQ41_9BACL|nr:ankyrin repeat domain-containing protein [Cohnella phaseoli]RED76105.1 ankyrin repeat protein [Cohnella phaseoli]
MNINNPMHVGQFAALFVGCAVQDDIIQAANMLDSGFVGINIVYQNQTLLSASAALGRTLILKWAVEQGADVNFFNNQHTLPALHQAAQCNQFECVKILAEAGANSGAGETFLSAAYYALRLKHLKIFHYLDARDPELTYTFPPAGENFRKVVDDAQDLLCILYEMQEQRVLDFSRTDPKDLLYMLRKGKPFFRGFRRKTQEQRDQMAQFLYGLPQREMEYFSKLLYHINLTITNKWDKSFA